MASSPSPCTPSPNRARPSTSRDTPNGTGRVNGFRRVNRNSPYESPTRILEEFSRLLLDQQRAFTHALDKSMFDQEQKHLAALHTAFNKHRKVRKSAEQELDIALLEHEYEVREKADEQRRREEEAERKLDEQRLEQLRRENEELNRKEQVRRKEEALRKEKAEKAEAQRIEMEKEEASKKNEAAAQQARERKKREEEEARKQAIAQEAKNEAAKQKPAQAQPLNNGAVFSVPMQVSGPPRRTEPQALTNIPAGMVTPLQAREAKHRDYLDLHKRLKQMRQHVAAECKRLGTKDQLSTWRRQIQKCCGQLMKQGTAAAKSNNRRVQLEITGILDQAAKTAQPSVNITHFLVENKQPPNAPTHGPGPLLFLLNQLAKKAIAQFIQESSDDVTTADSIGVVLAATFARPNYLFNGQSLIDVFWAKMHKSCPVLFGISGDEKTPLGRARLGWPSEFDAENRRAMISDDVHYRQTFGLAAGFASVTLRNFSKSKNRNPAPNHIFWEAAARIMNTPKGEVQPTQFVALKAMMETGAERVKQLFGSQGVTLMRQALVIFPRDRASRTEQGMLPPTALALQALALALKSKYGLQL